MHYRDPRLDAKLIKGWVVIGHDSQVHRFETFEEAIHGPSGHVMSEQYYEYHYKPEHEAK